jgi:hypothetical protein
LERRRVVPTSDTFMRSLAKIGYAYAVALLGYGSFTPLVTPYILGKSKTGCHWVGGNWDVPEAQRRPSRDN